MLGARFSQGVINRSRIVLPENLFKHYWSNWEIGLLPLALTCVLAWNMNMITEAPAAILWFLNIDTWILRIVVQNDRKSLDAWLFFTKCDLSSRRLYLDCYFQQLSATLISNVVVFGNNTDLAVMYSFAVNRVFSFTTTFDLHNPVGWVQLL